MVTTSPVLIFEIMNDIDLHHYKEVLLQRKKDILDMQQSSKDSTRPVDLDQSSVGRLSRMDAMQSQAMALENKRRREIELTRIDAAFDRIEEGEYGYCAACDEEIDQRRLSVDPANPFCVACASKM